jgi:ribosome maturation protein Sdo1
LDFIKDLKKVIPIERAKMRIKISFENEEQKESLSKYIKENHENDCQIERITEKLM